MKASASAARSAPKPLRCAIYTRKSTEQGLEQAFNSLDNQREAAEAYIKSQSHEGWRLLPGHYDDGGFSGGSLERPALQLLLAEVRAGRIDVIVVYKVDRLTRSLSDFAKLVDLFDTHGVSFVSVTQAFNTTTSMGRLTLNVLLSFAQFEREVTGERIRDKIAASKQKGLRVGGPVPLGYQVRGKKLVPCPIEAELVRLIFRGYIEHGSLGALLQHLDARGAVTKLHRRFDGSARGGVTFNKSGLSHLLKNRCYIGEVIHKGRYYPGEHEAIVSPDQFEAVQQALALKFSSEQRPNANRDSLLKGILYDAGGHRMTPTSSRSRGPLYRYYISRPVNEGRRAAAPLRHRVSAPDIEAKVLQALGIDASPASSIEGASEETHTVVSSAREQVLNQVRRVTLLQTELRIEMTETEGEESQNASVVIPWTDTRFSARQTIIDPPGASRVPQLIRSAPRARLVQGIANARLWLDELVAGTVADLRAIADRESCSERHVRTTLNLAFLEPRLVEDAVDGTLPSGSGVVSLSDVPLWWSSSIEG